MMHQIASYAASHPELAVLAAGAAVNLLLGLMHAEESKFRALQILDAALSRVLPDPVGFVQDLVRKQVSK